MELPYDLKSYLPSSQPNNVGHEHGTFFQQLFCQRGLLKILPVAKFEKLVFAGCSLFSETTIYAEVGGLLGVRREKGIYHIGIT